MEIIMGLLAIIIVIGLSWLLSNDKKNVNFKGVVIMLVLKILITWFMFATTIGQTLIQTISAGFDKLIEYGQVGINFVLGGFELQESGVFFFNVLLLIVFFATLLSVLTYLKILPTLIKWVGALVSKITGLPKIESFNAVNSIFFGQSEALIAIRSQFHHLTENRLYIVTASAMSSVSASIVGAYIQMLPPEYILVALPLNMFSGLIIASVIAPVNISKEEDRVDITDVSTDRSVF